MNPDFTKLGLSGHPHCDYDTWKGDLEGITGTNHDSTKY